MSRLAKKLLADVIAEQWNAVWKSPLRTMADEGSVSIGYGENLVELTIDDVDGLTALIAGFDDGVLTDPGRIAAAKILKCTGFAVIDGELYWKPLPVVLY